MSETKRWIVTGTSMVVEADTADEAIARSQDQSGWHWEAQEWGDMETLLYEKCMHCHLFVDDNPGYDGQDGVMPLTHLSRGDDADERFEDHEPMRSGMKANLDTWRVFGPSLMRERFVNKDRV